MLQLAGVPLLCPSLEAQTGLELPEFQRVCSWVERNLTLRDVVPFVSRGWPGSPARGLASITFPTGMAPLPAVTPNRLTWPGWGCSRWGVGFYLASASDVGAIRQEAFDQDGRGFNAVLLEMDSPGSRANESFSAWVYLMPPKPLSGIRGVNGLYLLTVVDARYYWWNVGSPGLGIECEISWESCIDLCLFAINAAFPDTTLGHRDTVPPAYQKPHRLLTSLKDEPFPVVFDAILYNCGLRLVYTPADSVSLVNAATAQANLAAELGKANRSLRAGGGHFLDQL